MRDLTQHFTAQADDSHAPPVSAFLKAPFSFKRIVHALARRALDINSLLVWMEEVSHDIVHVLLNDFSAINS